MSLLQQLDYRVALLERDLRTRGFSEKQLQPTEETLGLLSQYYPLKQMQKMETTSLRVEEIGLGERPTYLNIDFTGEGRTLPSPELRRRLEYLRMDRSRPEIIIRSTLEQLFPGVTFPTVRPGFLRYPPTGQNLEFDIYNAALRLAVEYNGIQHYQYTPAFHKSPADLLAQQERDAFKASRAKDLGIDLLVIPYTVKEEDIPGLVTAWVSELGRTSQEIGEAQRQSRCEEIVITPELVVSLWSEAPVRISEVAFRELEDKLIQCRATPEEIIVYEKMRWTRWFGREATPELYLQLRPYLDAALRLIAWPQGETQEKAFLLEQVLSLIQVKPGQEETISSRDLLEIEDELNALHPSLVRYWPELEPIQDVRYFPGYGGRLYQRVVTDPTKKSYKPIVKFLNALVGDYFGYQLQVVQEKRVAGKRVYLLQWQPKDPLFLWLVEKIRAYRRPERLLLSKLASSLER
jgi:hypothetical protein